jgi:NADH-quinone oxidoreductase subunit F
VDLHLIPGAVASEAERQAVDAVVDGGSLRPAGRHLLLPALHAVQEQAGWISEGALNYICTRLEVPPAEAYGVATFYALFSLGPRPSTVVHVCDDVACRLRGAEALCRDLTERLGPEGTAVSDGRALWLRSPCLGQCERAPAALYQLAGQNRTSWTLTRATADRVRQGLDAPLPLPDVAASVPQAAAGAHLDLLARVGRVNPESLDDYRASGGYAALRSALRLGPEGVIREITESGLLGRGGAAFPTGRKWDAVARAPVGPHYVVCNADESEPGTFKDRVLMEEDPFALLEAMTIAGFATGSEHGYVYVRGEYPLARHRLATAIAQARARGLLGDNVLGAGVCFDVELRVGAGAYICGEETALFNSLEGFRGEPRNKPPFPVQQGLFGKPTLVNNVETLVNVLRIVGEGGAAFARIGTTGSTGPKLFCVSGSVVRPGLYEVPFGTTLRELLALAGGPPAGRRLRTVLLGGAAGVFVDAEADLPLTFEGTRAAGATLGSGVVLAVDDTADLADLLLRIAAFFRDESCGQCVPCRVGTVRQEEALHRLARRRSTLAREGPLIDELAQVMRDASICGLGHTASTAVQSALRAFGPFAREAAS